MSYDRSRRAFLKQGSMWAALSAGGVLRPAWTQTPRRVEAETTFGWVRGIDSDGIKTFKGIPYGASTAMENRFMPPRDPERWAGVRDALVYGPSAPQREPGARVSTSSRAVAARDLPYESEDCLVLNVWTPAVRDGRRRPVMVWCHGGGFASGSGSSPVTDGTNLARRGDIVVVSINHRLNVLGFTNLSELGGSAFAQSAEVGMLDIVHALKWVRGNIAEFGGDPGNVTVFGQSGGGRKVATLLAMPKAVGLFHRAIIESGATLKLVEREQGLRVARALLKEVGLEPGSWHELQTLPLDQLMSAYHATVRAMSVDQMTMGFSPNVDGVIIPQHPFHPKASAVSANVPLIVGSTRTELTSSADNLAFSLDEAAMRRRVSALLGDSTDAVLDAYRRANPGASPATNVTARPS
jgi:para-nitrobenzyl esterase